MPYNGMIYLFRDLGAEQQAKAGGKGQMLARLFQRGYPVPNGFVILPDAFEYDDLKPSLWPEIQKYVLMLHPYKKCVSYAVRSSAVDEDSAQTSFAGEFETVLKVSGDKALQDAIHRVYSSRKSDRVMAYIKERKLLTVPDMAIVVQVMVDPDISGVLFSADPLTGSRNYMVGNFVYGSGEQLVSGETNTETFTIERIHGRYKGSAGLRRYIHRLYEFAKHLEKEMSIPQDIEWAVAGGKLYLLQARPITTLSGYNPTTGECNDSHRGDYLWTNTNWGEAVPDVMTPFTWSIFLLIGEMSSIKLPAGHPYNGNIGGRFYFNAGLYGSMASALGIDIRKLAEYGQAVFGWVPANVNIPIIPLDAWDVVRTYGISVIRESLTIINRSPKIPSLILESSQLGNELIGRIQSIQTPNELISLWSSTIKPYARQINKMMDHVIGQMFNEPISLRRDLAKLLGDADVGALLSGFNQGKGNLTSLEPLLGLWKMANGEISRDDYAQWYGHRSQHEIEMSIPRPAEDPDWIDKQVAEFSATNIDVFSMLSRQQIQHEAAWERLRSNNPRIAKALRKRFDRVAEQARLRESVRSEWARMFWVLRTFAIRSGELTGTGDDIFFLTIDEVMKVLNGNNQVGAYIPLRRETYAKYCNLPAYPAIINGRFDPAAWANDPNRRVDIFDSHMMPTPPSSDRLIIGFGGAAGVVKGIVRKIGSLEEVNQLLPGEILVTRLVNVGWTIHFPIATAIITDIGAPLSHAAIVARELGIPMVVGCGNATTRLNTGDNVRVDGGHGTVEVIH